MKQPPLFHLLFGLLSVLLTAGFWRLAGGTSPTQAAPDASAEALIAVQFNHEDQIVRGIRFDAPISGLEALQLSGLPLETADFGGGFIAVCSINGVGCPAENCFCDTKFWNYEYWDGSAWQGYLVGASDSSVSDGAIEGWRWAEWGVGSLPDATLLKTSQEALDWLALQQSPQTGGYGNGSLSSETLLAIGANDYSAFEWRYSPSSPTLMGYMMGIAADYADAGDTSGKLSAGLSAADGCYPHGARQPLDYYDPLTGQYSGQYGAGAGPQAWAILGTASLNQAVPANAAAALSSLQQADGGWEWVPGGFGGGTDTNTTALAIQALIAAGFPTNDSKITAGLDYLRNAQNDDGGFPYDPDSPWGTDSDTNSTAYAVQAIRASGGDPASWTVGSADPISFLLGMQLSDGSFEYISGGGSNLSATQQAVPALLGRSLPISQAELPGCPVSFLPLIAGGADQ